MTPSDRAPPLDCVVIGGGLAGAAVAASLARRDRRVCVLDIDASAAAGASALPVGLFVPHVSPDDALLSRLTRAGVAATLGQARVLLREDQDWQCRGVLEHGIKPAARERRQLPAGVGEWHGSRVATAQELMRAGLPPDTPALWHTQAGWLKPAALVRALLAQPGITWRGETAVDTIARDGDLWVVHQADGRALARAPMVVVAAGPASRTLLCDRLPLQPLRGQVAWGVHAPDAPGLPPFPVNGHGSVVAGVPWRVAGEDRQIWCVGSTFERDSLDATVHAKDHGANLERLQTLLPASALALAAAFETGQVNGWAGVRATLPDRLPAVGEPDPDAAPGLYACTGLGARGLTLAVLCGELLAAQALGEPLPLEAPLARALAAHRFSRRRAPASRAVRSGAGASAGVRD